MVDKLIRGEIVEIIVVLCLVIISIPIWNNFEERISAAEVTTLDDYEMYFDVYNIDNTDTIVVTNEYYINKNYKILLVIDKDFDQEKSNILINDKEYKINEFYYEKKNNKYVYTLVDEYISADINYYDIKPTIMGMNNNYSYDFIENNVF